ncbi:MAG: CocE/NonD family hydrolase [Actinomycetota bacterium]|nr:CocE/NonD family hydrolase [Actinomycetota bacterium]
MPTKGVLVRRMITVALTASFCLSLSPSPAQADPDYETTQGKSRPKYEKSVVEEYRVDTEWGEIYGVVRRPVVPKGVEVPVILTYTPYSALWNPLSPLSEASAYSNDSGYFVPRGYAWATFDLAGTGQSGGCYDYGGVTERRTGAAVVNFLGTRNWSNGRVGMIGGSYDGATQWAAAVEAPKHLTTIVPQVAVGRWYDYAYSQGVRYWSGTATPFAFDYGFGLIPTHVTAPSPETLVDHINPCERLEHNQRGFLPDPVYDQFWDERDYLRLIDKVEASVMIEGSWVDSNVHPRNSIYMWNALPDKHPKRLVMAQQGHGSANLPDSDNIRHAWFDYWLLGLKTGVMKLPAVDSLANDGRRLQSDQWPPPRTKRVPFEFSTKDDGVRSLSLIDAQAPTWTDANPALDHQWAIAGQGGPADLLFLSRPFKSDIRIAGFPVMRAAVTSNMENTWLTPVMFEETANHSRRVITTGMLNARNRNGLRTSEPITPGKTWKGTVEFQPTDFVLQKGSRLGVAVMSVDRREALYSSGYPATNKLKLKASELVVPMAPVK